MVAPYMGAWIEILTDTGHLQSMHVAPYMGAWIEIYPILKEPQFLECRTLHGCVD